MDACTRRALAGGICGARPAGVFRSAAASCRPITQAAPPLRHAFRRACVVAPCAAPAAVDPDEGMSGVRATCDAGGSSLRQLRLEFRPPAATTARLIGAGELSRVAIAALVSGSSVSGSWVPGHLQPPRNRHSRGQLTGRGVATIAIVLGVFDMIVTTVLAIVLAG